MTLQTFTLGTFAQQGAAAAGDFDSIATTTVGAGGAADVTFSSIPSTYTHLQIRMLAGTNRATNTGDNFRIQLNSDTASNYRAHYLSGDGAAAFSGDQGALAFMEFGRLANANNSNIFGAGVIDLLDYKDTNKFKTLRAFVGYDINGDPTTSNLYLNSGLWRSTSAVTTIKVYPAYGTLWKQYTHIALYGIKAA